MCKDPEQPVWQQRAGEGQEVARKASQGPLERAVEGHRRLALVNRRSGRDAPLRPLKSAPNNLRGISKVTSRRWKYVSALQGGPSSGSPDCLKRTVLGGPKNTARRPKCNFGIHCEYPATATPPLTSALRTPETIMVFGFSDEAIFTRPAKKRCFGLCEGGRK
jgi:hypothetical protein